MPSTPPHDPRPSRTRHSNQNRPMRTKTADLTLAARKNSMLTRTSREAVTFRNPFYLERGGRLLPPGNYEVVTDEELIEGLSFPAYRRVATTMMVPAQSYQGSFEMVTIDPIDLIAALERDAAPPPMH